VPNVTANVIANVIAIDGPSGVGKSTAARRVAARLGWGYMDTGAMYRAVTLMLEREGISVEDGDALGRVLASMDYEQRGESYFLNGEDVSGPIRSPEVTGRVSKVSADASVREALVSMQRKLGRAGDWVVDGRDIGTVVFPDAKCKVFLVASPQARAQRRFLELQARGAPATLEGVLQDQARRDEYDSTRAASPLRRADDAVELDSSHLSAEEVVERILQIFSHAGPACQGG
jgi:cytidylate kinase